jgi:flavin reductase (DIM6/NTAB) family NADH-FMN oxidoreductase RutF
MFNNRFTKTNHEALTENFFKAIQKEWMLITAGSIHDFNTMTASWGTIGILWNKPITICFVRPQRHTFGYMEKSEHYTLSFFDHAHKEILNYCGSHSGKTVDKIHETGLIPIETPSGCVGFEQSRLVIECKKIYADFFKAEHFLFKQIIDQNYQEKDFHQFYIGEITGCYKKSG